MPHGWSDASQLLKQTDQDAHLVCTACAIELTTDFRHQGGGSNKRMLLLIINYLHVAPSVVKPLAVVYEFCFRSIYVDRPVHICDCLTCTQLVWAAQCCR